MLYTSLTQRSFIIVYILQVANYCCHCGIQFGLYYFCAICNFYDDANKGQFHCEKCGICRYAQCIYITDGILLTMASFI